MSDNKQTLQAIIGEATEIAQLVAELQDRADDGMTDEEQMDVLLTWFGQNQAAFSAKCDSYIHVIKDYEAKETAVKDEVKRLQARAKSHAGNVARLKDALKRAMIALGMDSCKTALNTVSLAKSGTIAYDVDPDAVPIAYQRTKVEIDRTAIQTALKAGLTVRGVTVKESELSLRIR